MTITEDDLVNELRRLNDELQPSRKPGEFTANEFAQAQDPPITRDRARTILKNGVRDGKLTRRAIGRFWYYKRI